MPTEALLFDFDDTLVRTSNLGPRVFCQTLIDEFDVALDDDQRNLVKSAWSVLAEQNLLTSFLALQHGIDEGCLRHRYFAQYNEHIATASFVDGAEEALDWAREHFKVGLVTGSSRDQIRSFLVSHAMENFFNVIVTRDDVPMKPNPAGYLKASRHLGIPPSSCVAVEDSIDGVKAALAAEMRVIKIGTYPTTEAEASSRLSIASFGQFRSVVQECMDPSIVKR